MRVLMWEAKGDADGIIAWLRDEALAELPTDTSAELFRSADRVVVLLKHLAAEPSGASFRLPDPPADLVARPPHAWPFETVD
ncbi:MAG TPA: hypothetical protein VKV34_02555 [Thermoleophilia bacterium]|jgi:hypothetical protein|nr:hypothetical protein [Thermoleophilia bacterium]